MRMQPSLSLSLAHGMLGSVRLDVLLRVARAVVIAFCCLWVAGCGDGDSTGEADVDQQEADAAGNADTADASVQPVADVAPSDAQTDSAPNDAVDLPDGSLDDTDAADARDSNSQDGDADPAEEDGGEDTPDPDVFVWPQPYPRDFIWTDMHDWLRENADFPFGQIPYNPECEDDAWNPVAGRGVENGFTEIQRPYGRVRNMQMQRAGGVVCVDGFRMWVEPNTVADAVSMELRADRDVFGGAAHTFSYVLRWTSDQSEPADRVRVLLDIGEFAGSPPANASSEIIAYPRAQQEGAEFAIDHIVRTDFGWRMYASWPATLFIGRDRPPARCGNGVLDPGEMCDYSVPPEQVTGAMYCGDECTPRGTIECVTGEPGECGPKGLDYCREVQGVENTDCLYVFPMASLDACQVRPINEGGPCYMEETARDSCNWQIEDCTPGRCQAGACVPNVEEECTPCATSEVLFTGWPERWVDGECREAPPDERNESTDIYFPGVCSRYGDCTAAERSECLRTDRANEVHSTEFRWYRWATYARTMEIEYRHRSWAPDETGAMVPAQQFGLRVEHNAASPDTEFFHDYVVELPDEPHGETGFFTLELPPGTDRVELVDLGVGSHWPNCVPAEGIEVSSSYAYTIESPRCERVFESGDELRYCPDRIPVVDCDGECVDTSNDVLNCGGCGVACTGFDVCIGGECVCPPEIETRNPDACDGCPVGFGGPDCAWECLGQIGEGIYCNGRGECPPGPYGDAHCQCDDGFHGLSCEFTCSDGIRNGDEWGVDCGPPCGYGCGVLDGSTLRGEPVPIDLPGSE